MESVRFLDWLGAEIARYDRMCAETEWTVDAEIYNGCAHALRRVRDEYRKEQRESDLQDTKA